MWTSNPKENLSLPSMMEETMTVNSINQCITISGMMFLKSSSADTVIVDHKVSEEARQKSQELDLQVQDKAKVVQMGNISLK
jgi:hypothetical protein